MPRFVGSLCAIGLRRENVATNNIAAVPIERKIYAAKSTRIGKTRCYRYTVNNVCDALVNVPRYDVVDERIISPGM